MNSIVNKIKILSETIINLDEKVGFKKLVKYVGLGFVIMIFVNFRTVLRSGIELIAEINNEIHNEKMQLRDELLSELEPLLADFRSNVRADRILYFEYHNTNTNLVGIPFKYVELTQQNSGYGVPLANVERFKDINTGIITRIYEDIKFGGVAYCSSENDSVFRYKYPGIFESISERDNSKRFIFISIPGINIPIGLVVLEWMSDSTEDLDLKEISNIAAHKYIPQINALILSKKK